MKVIVNSATTAAMGAMLALAGGVFAQERAEEQRIAELIEALHMDKPGSSEALRTAGAAGLRMLERRLEDGLNVNQSVLDYLRRSGPEAWAFTGPLRSTLADLDDSLLIEAGWALLAIAPYEEKLSLMAEVEDAGRTRRAEVREEITDIRLQLAWSRKTPVAGKRGEVARKIPSYPSYLQLAILQNLPTWNLEPDVIVPLIHHLLIQGDTTRQVWYADSDGNGHALDLSPALRRLAAETIISMAPNRPEAAAAYGYLAQRKPNPAEALRAIVALGQKGYASGALPYLVEILEGESEVRLLAEVVTTLGMIGPAAKDVIPALEKLTEHVDPQIAERAKAALRQIRGSWPAWRPRSSGKPSRTSTSVLERITRRG